MMNEKATPQNKQVIHPTLITLIIESSQIPNPNSYGYALTFYKN